MHLLILPFVCCAVGAVAGAAARKPVLVAILGVLPFRLFIMTSDSLGLLTILSLLLDIGIAVGCSVLIVRLRGGHAPAKSV